MSRKTHAFGDEMAHKDEKDSVETVVVVVVLHDIAFSVVQDRLVLAVVGICYGISCKTRTRNRANFR